MTRIILTTVAALCIAATAASAKGHDQGNTTVPGSNDVGSTTVASAQSLGGALGERPDTAGPKGNNPAASNAGR